MKQQPTRVEIDSLGEVKVPADALYGAQTQRAVNHFSIGGHGMPRRFIQALGLIKAAAAKVNAQLGDLDPVLAEHIIVAAEAVAEGRHDEAFPVDVFQTGSGTSSNMNANEVIATLASRSAEQVVHPNDHVNRAQSSNDVIPTAIHVSAVLACTEELMPALAQLEADITARAKGLEDVITTGRTHLMDAMPISLGQMLSGWAEQIRHAQDRVKGTLERLYPLAQGGTAVGTGVNAPAGFGDAVAATLANRTGLPFCRSQNYFESISTQDAAVELSGQLRVIAVGMMKISNDLRWMNSGPLAGLGEITLPVLQPGSSIMPGKVNPVIPEAVTQVAAQVIGNDTAITVAGQSGNFQLNTMLPLVANNLLQSIALLARASHALAEQAIRGFVVNQDRMEAVLHRNPILVTALNSVIGYARGAEIAKRAYAENRPIRSVALEMTDLSEEAIDQLLDPANLI
ncbi:aspartate ammonia-lyase [Spiribacter sp. C176]|uniref:Fumarate hydratase class II n=1 Tax=Spiribacter salilacus TaxID=2664894 RepID=A0A6N7QLF6_9GAMM|nr:class II fumarate hydratase [Spiribacter salilacus]MRH77316.1 aspartate ammonia-lyase [Spiribacter salilacus]